jgi:hypothetical protein
VSLDRFDQLRERLLRAGIAPRHVRRYVTELQDHFDDLVREETDKGLTGGAAEQAAHARLGSDEELSTVMLARPDLRSVTARFPWAVFGFGPVLILALAIASALFVQVGIIFASPEIPLWSIPWARLSFDIVNWLATYAAPLAIAAALSVLGIRQRMPMSWIALGLATICIVGGFHEIGVKWSSVPAQPSELYVSFAFAPPFPEQLIVTGVFRAAVNVVLVGMACWLWLRVKRRALPNENELPTD